MMLIYLVFFFFNDTATTEIYTLSLHDALPILDELRTGDGRPLPPHLKAVARRELEIIELLDRQIEAVKAERDALLAAAQTAEVPSKAVQMLLGLKGIGSGFAGALWSEGL